MKKILFLFALLSAVITSSKAQNYAIDAGNDTVVCNNGSVGLHATIQNLVNGTVLPYPGTLTDDGYSSVVNIGFTFNFYGNNYTQCLISTNGYITFDLTDASGYSPWSINSTIPSNTNPINAIMGPWQDVNPALAGAGTTPIQYASFGVAPNRTFVVQFDSPMFDCTTDCFGNQIILHETTNIIETHIGNKPLCATWNGGQAVHGVQNAAGTIAACVPGRNANQQWTAFQEGTQFTYSGANYTIATIPFSPIFLGVSANSSITWSVMGSANPFANGANAIVSPIANTTYVCAVSTNTCSSNAGATSSFTYYDTVTVSISNPIIVAGSQNADCLSGNGGMVWASVTGAAPPYVFSWNTVPATLNDTAYNVVVGTHTVTLTDANGCIATGTAVVTQQGSMNSAIVSTVDLVCNGTPTGNIEVVGFGATAPYTYFLNNDTSLIGIFSNLSAGVHDVLIVDSIGCSTHQLVTINQPANPLNLQITLHKNIDCYGNSNGQFHINATGGTVPYVYGNSLTSNSTGVFDNLFKSTYLLSVTDANGCYFTILDSIIQPEILIATVASVADVTCFGLGDGSATASIVGGTAPYTKSWSNNPGVDVITMTNIVAGNYELTVNDANGCNSNAQFSVIEPQPLNIVASNDTSICEGLTTMLIASAAGGTGNINFTWFPGNFQNDSIEVSPLLSSTYTVVATDQNGCQVQEPVVVSVYSAPLPDFSVTSLNGCQPFCPTFTDITPNPIGSIIIARNWDFGDGKVGAGEVVDHCYTESGSLAINLTITTDKGCRRIVEWKDYITVYPMPEALYTALPTETTINNPSVIFDNISVGGASYVWNFGDNDSIFTTFDKNHTYQDTGLFEVQLVAISDQGCIDSSKTFIKINPFYTFFIPTSFSPNGDGKNDVFEIRGDYIQTCSMQVFDRWGKTLFNQSGGKDVSWDADNTPQGTYMYKIKMKDTQNKDYEYVGSLTVLR